MSTEAKTCGDRWECWQLPHLLIRIFPLLFLPLPRCSLPRKERAFLALADALLQQVTRKG